MVLKYYDGEIDTDDDQRGPRSHFNFILMLLTSNYLVKIFSYSTQ